MTKRGMAVHWLQNCSTVKEREDRKDLIKRATPTLAVLLEIIDRLRLDALAVREADYADSAWAYKQAHLNGRLEELDLFTSLLRSAIDHDHDN